jgi:hypothetical protein
MPLEPVARVIYTSLCDVQGPVLDEMRRIRDRALLNNASQEIRVALLYLGGAFVEWIEGPAQGIEVLLARVAGDPRHHGMTVIHRSSGRPRLFKPWIGTIVQSQDSSNQFAQRVFGEMERQAKTQPGEPVDVWLRLCAPTALDMPRPLGRNPRAMMLCAQGHGVFELLAWIARQEQRLLVRRRYAGGADDALDVESDYVDLPATGPRGWRLIANARKGLAMGMTHAFLPAYPAVVLLFGGSATRNQRIVERVLVACQQVHHSPCIIGLGSRSDVTPQLQALVERQGLPWLSAVSEAAEPEALWQALEPALLQLG